MPDTVGKLDEMKASNRNNGNANASPTQPGKEKMMKKKRKAAVTATATDSCGAPASSKRKSSKAPKKNNTKTKKKKKQQQQQQKDAVNASAEVAGPAEMTPVDRAPYQRVVRFRALPTGSIADRIQRARTQRLFLIKASQVPASGAGEKMEFAVLGSTGNVYTVGVGARQVCTCPDFLRGNLCKHVLFVMLKVLKEPHSSPIVWQTGLAPSERASLFARFARRLARISGRSAQQVAGQGQPAVAGENGSSAVPPQAQAAGQQADGGTVADPIVLLDEEEAGDDGEADILASADVRAAFERVSTPPGSPATNNSGKASTGAAAAVAGSEPRGCGSVAQKQLEGDDDCVICFEALLASTGRKNSKANALIWCSSSCGQSMHKTCADAWSQQKIGSGQAVTCPCCRAQWPSAQNRPVAGSAGRHSNAAANGNGYLNLAVANAPTFVQHSSSWNRYAGSWRRRRQW